MFILKNFEILEKNIFELLKKITLKIKFKKKLRIKIGNFGKKKFYLNCKLQHLSKTFETIVLNF